MAYVDHILAVRTHCPLLLPIEWHSEIFGLEYLLCLNWSGVASNDLDFTLDYWADNYSHNCVTCTTICKPGYNNTGASL